jgi:Holliday junction DNA helicase RuvA
MIYFVRGTVHSFTADTVVIDCGGIGYQINFVHQDQIALGQTVTVYTYHQFRQDAQELYGFLDPKELDLFEKLISVKGLGCRTAMNMLGHSTADQLIRAIENGEVDVLTKLPGLGAKTSKQIILDLKGKLVEDSADELKGAGAEIEEAAEGLTALGYKSYEINAIVPQLKKMPKTTADGYLKAALQLLLKRKGG